MDEMARMYEGGAPLYAVAERFGVSEHRAKACLLSQGVRMRSRIEVRRLCCSHIWTPDRVLALKKLWLAGWSCSQIGAHLGTNKNAVAGKARRLRLPARPSPIKEGSTSMTYQEKPFERTVTVSPGGPFRTCQWIKGEPKDRDFCGKPSQPGSSYCPEHHKRVWIAA